MWRTYYCSNKPVHRVTLTDEGYTLEDKCCPACKRIAGLTSEPGAHVTNRNVQMSDPERESLTVPFGARARKFRNAKDVDKRIEKFKQRNPILQEGYHSKSIVAAARAAAERAKQNNG